MPLRYAHALARFGRSSRLKRILLFILIVIIVIALLVLSPMLLWARQKRSTFPLWMSCNG